MIIIHSSSYNHTSPLPPRTEDEHIFLNIFPICIHHLERTMNGRVMFFFFNSLSHGNSMNLEILRKQFQFSFSVIHITQRLFDYESLRVKILKDMTTSMSFPSTKLTTG